MKGCKAVSTLVWCITASLAAGAASGAESPGQIAPGEMAAEAAPPRNPLMEMPAGQLVDREVITPAGERIGRVQKVVVEPQQEQAYVVVRVGGFFGIGARSVAIPIQELRLRNDDLNMTEQVAGDELAEHYPYREERFRGAEGNQSLAAAVSMASGEFAAFSRLDQDGDGFVSRTEAQADAGFTEQWQALDKNGDDRVDRDEFGAFEGALPETQLGAGDQSLRVPDEAPLVPANDDRRP